MAEWYQQNTVYTPEPVSALKFDPYQEVLQVGSQTGFLRYLSTADLSLRCSVRAHSSPIKSILNVPIGVLSLSKSCIRLHSHGGVPKATLNPPEKTVEGEEMQLEDMCFDASEIDTNSSATRVIAGSTSSEVYVYDMNFIGSKSAHASPFAFSLGKEPNEKGIKAVNFASGKKVLLCGGGNGIMYIIDGRNLRLESTTRSMRSSSVRALKSASITAQFPAFQNGITSITANRDQIIVCGHSPRAMKPRAMLYHDPSNPIEFYSDALVKVFDLRMMRGGMPLQFPFSTAPSCASFLPGHGSTVCAMSYTGAVTMMDTRYDLSMASVLQTETNGAHATKLATAVTGKVFAFGDQGGGVHLWTNSVSPEMMKSSYYGNPLESLPTFQPPPSKAPISAEQVLEDQIRPQSYFRLNMDDQPPTEEVRLGLYAYESASYTINRPPTEGGMSFSPSVLPSTFPLGFLNAWAGGSTRLAINPKLLREEKMVENISYVDTNGSVVETEMNMKDISGTLLYGENKWKAYIDVDPRRQKGWNDSNALATVKIIEKEDGTSAYFDERGNELQIPPEHLRATKTKLNDFFRSSEASQKIAKFNKSRFAGLENNLPNSYINPIVSTFYFLRPVRNAFIGHLSPLDPCLTDELGFVFHMLDQIQLVDEPDKCVELLNFQAAFRRIPEASALGLLEPSKLIIPRRVGHMTRFLIQHVLKEMRLTEDRAGKKGKKGNHNLLSPCKYGGNALEKLFGVHFRNKDVSASGYETVRDTTSNVIDLLEESEVKGSAANRAESASALPMSFATRLRMSLTKTIKVARAWCEGSKKYEPLVKYRRMCNLPQLLCINVVSDDNSDCLEGWRENEVPDSPHRWLPERIRIRVKGETKKGIGGDLEIDEIHDATSEVEDIDEETPATPERTYELVSVISHIQDPLKGDSSEGHLVAHIKVPEYDTDGRATGNREWMVFNDLRVAHATLAEVVDFRHKWRSPCVLFFRWTGLSKERRYSAPPNIQIHPSIFRSPSLGQGNMVSRGRSFQPLSEGEVLKKGDMVAIDCEFVSTGAEESEVDANGRRVVVKAAKLSLARVSVTRANGVPFIDDYIVTTEPVVDYLTRFSGIVPGDLDPTTTRHHLVTLKTAYLKLRYLVDQGVKFVGHGLKKDFLMINIHVPSSQIIDTVHLYHLPGQRMIGLSFLVKHVLGAGIQDASKGHDSIEDAHGALYLYRKYEELQKAGRIDSTLKELYDVGHRTQWR
jgi:hypothetical protein|eukprot:Stramenopile-MAST_4_protein_3133